MFLQGSELHIGVSRIFSLNTPKKGNILCYATDIAVHNTAIVPHYTLDGQLYTHNVEAKLEITKLVSKSRCLQCETFLWRPYCLSASCFYTPFEIMTQDCSKNEIVHI